MFCLEKLQRELADFFDRDLEELPSIKDTLKEIGYTQIQKGDEIIPLDSTPKAPQPLSKPAQDYAHKILQGLRKTAQTPLNKLADEVPSIDRGFMLREARHMKSQAQEFADSFASLRWQDLKTAIRYAKVPYDEAMFRELKASIESKEFAKFIESLPKPPTQKGLFDSLESTATKIDTELESTPRKAESTLNNTLESYQAHERATTKLKRSIFEKEKELKDLVAEKEKVEQWAETIKEQSNSRALTKIAKELEKIGFDTFSKRPMMDYEVPLVKKINPRLDGAQFYDESTIINFKDLKKFIKSHDDFIKFKDKLDTLYLADYPYGNARYVYTIKDFDNTKQARFYQAFSESNYDNIIKELIEKEASKVKNIDNDKIISLQKELDTLKEQLEKTSQSLAQSESELEQIPFLQKLFNNKALFNDFLVLRFNTMSEKELKKQAQKAFIDIDISRGYFEKALDITPIQEFGTNYAEHYHSGESAVQKLLVERQGQVAGAFYRKELGDIDLVWGDANFGLQHILDKHGSEFNDIAKELSEVVEKGEVVKTHNGYNITLGDYKVGLNIGWNENGIKIGENKWVVTAFDNSKTQSEKQGSNSTSFTKGETLPLNSSEIIPQKQATSLFDTLESTATKIDTELESSTHLAASNAQTRNDEKKTLQSFQQAISDKDIEAKIDIAKEYLEHLLNPLKEQETQLKELIKNKNFDDDEIVEALQRIETTAKPSTRKPGKIFVPFVDKPSTGWIISDRLTPLEQAKTLLSFELERESKRFFTKVRQLKGEIGFLDRLKKAKQEGKLEQIHFDNFDETLDFIAKELKKQDLAKENAKSYDLTYKQARDLFYQGRPTQIQAELFEKVLPIAQKLGVNIRSAVRFRYENAGSNFTKDIAGLYRTNPNAATLKKGISKEIKHKVLLHELIHSVTSRAIYAYDRKQLDLLTTPQQNAIKNIKEIYAELFEKRDELGLKRWKRDELLDRGDYGLKNEHEMLAELANPNFVEKLKNIGIFEKLMDNIIKIIASAKEIFGLKKTNAYERLKTELESIITNYKDDFTTQWEAQKFRDRVMGSDNSSAPAKAYDKELEKMEYEIHKLEAKQAELETQKNEIYDPYYKKIKQYKTKLGLYEKGVDPFRAMFYKDATTENIMQEAHAKAAQILHKIDTINTSLSRLENELLMKKEQLAKEQQLLQARKQDLQEFKVKPRSWQGIEKIKNQAYVKDLQAWHKDSHKTTKNKDGSPKVFYHGTRASEKFEVFEKGETEGLRDGMFFSTSETIAKDYDIWDQGVYKVFLKYKNPLIIDFKGAAYNSKDGYAILQTIPNKLKKEHDAIIYKNIADDNQNGAGEIANTIVVFDSNQIKHIDNKGIENPSGAKHYFNEQSPNIFHSNPHLGAGLLGGSGAGFESDESGNITFSPEKFALGLLGGAVGSKAISKAHKKFLQSKPHKIIPFINKHKPTKPRFEVTKELEKIYRNAQVTPKQSIQNTLGLSGVVRGDFIKLAQKHPEYFATPQEAKELCDYVFQNAFIALQASDKSQALIIAKLIDSSNDYGSVAFRIQNINGEHRIRSVMLMEQRQVDQKIRKAQELGEPILQF